MTTERKAAIHKPQTGFTLVEVLAALAIVAIAAVGLLRLHWMSIAVADKADTLAQAVSVAQNKIAEMEAMDYSVLGTQSGSVEKNRTIFRWQADVSDWRLAQVPSMGQGLLRNVVVSVRWDRGLGKREVALSAILSDRRPK